MFGKKNKKQDVNVSQQSESAVSAAAPDVKTKAKKKKSGMSTIFRESVLETVMVDFRDNEAFVHKENGEDKFVGIMLDTKDIGGLDKKSKKVEAKGQLIECINSGRIKTLITEDLMEAECIIFIPEVFTLAAMDEFSLLTDATYELCYVEPNGDVELLGKKITYKEVTDILADDGHIDDILGSDEVEEEEEEPDALLQDDVSSDDDADIDPLDDFDDFDEDEDIAPLDDDDDDDDVPLLDEDNASSERPSSYASQQQTPQLEVPPFMGQQPVEQPQMEQQPMQDEMEHAIPQEWTEEAIVRKFYSDELGLEVTTDPFDAQFMQNNTFVPFDENRPSSWMNDNLNEMAKQANDEMNRMHAENLFLMRERYFRLISMHCDKVRKDLDINDPSTLYGQMKAQLDADYAEGLQSMDAQISAQKEELEAAWKQRLQEVGMDAAREAQHKYRERYQPAHDQKIYDIADAVKANVDAEYRYGIHDLNERRRTEASSLLDLGISEVLDEISSMYISVLEDERVRYRELAENMREFQNDYLQHDIARTNALQEELRQSEKADAVLAEQTAKIRQLSDEYAAKRRELTAEIESLRQDNKARLEMMQKDCDRDVQKVLDDKAALHDQYDKLLEKYKSLDAEKDEQYKARMNELHSELEAWSDKYDHIVEVHQKSNRVAILCVIAAMIAAISIGFIGGAFANSKHNVKQQLQAIQQQYDNNDAASDAADAE